MSLHVVIAWDGQAGSWWWGEFSAAEIAAVPKEGDEIWIEHALANYGVLAQHLPFPVIVTRRVFRIGSSEWGVRLLVRPTDPDPSAAVLKSSCAITLPRRSWSSGGNGGIQSMRLHAGSSHWHGTSRYPSASAAWRCAGVRGSSRY